MSATTGIPPTLQARGWHTPRERHMYMTLTPVYMETLPERTRGLSETNTALVADIAATLAPGIGVSDGIVYPDRKSAAKVGDHARRTFNKNGPPLAADLLVRARYHPGEDGGFRWTLFLADAKPAK